VHVDIGVPLQRQAHPRLPDGLSPLLGLDAATCAAGQGYGQDQGHGQGQSQSQPVRRSRGSPDESQAPERRLLTGGVQQALVTRTRKRTSALPSYSCNGRNWKGQCGRNLKLALNLTVILLNHPNPDHGSHLDADPKSES
jgi:hypothetical protein